MLKTLTLKFAGPVPASLEEQELWPDAVWRLSALMRAGATPAFACRSVADDISARKRAVKEELAGAPALERALKGRQNTAYVTALTEVADLLRAAATVAESGRPVSTVFETQGAACTRESVRTVAAQIASCWLVAEQAGAAVADVFERLARFLETEIDLRQQRETALSGPRATGRILSWLPLLGLALGIVMGTDPLGVLFGSVAGAVVGFIGLCLAYAGSRWTASLITRAERGTL
ncbi:type II secretion system F family protein [Rothia nasimurium]|uniref:type II secretion system F family protein n=1 Tax=Rothia nasimurium TaxID=85336 RepID=UPI003BA35D5E